MRGQISQGYCIPIPVLLQHPTRKLQLTTSTVKDEDGTERAVPALEDTETKDIRNFGLSSLPILVIISDVI